MVETHPGIPRPQTKMTLRHARQTDRMVGPTSPPTVYVCVERIIDDRSLAHCRNITGAEVKSWGESFEKLMGSESKCTHVTIQFDLSAQSVSQITTFAVFLDIPSV